MGTCDDALSHFSEILGGGNPDFAMSYDDAIKYLKELATQSPEQYSSWLQYVSDFADNRVYLSMVKNTTKGKFILYNIDDGNKYETIDDALSARLIKEKEQEDEFLANFAITTTVMACVPNDIGEDIQHTDKEIEGVSKYIVFNPIVGSNIAFNNFTDAIEELKNIKDEYKKRRTKIQIAQELIDGDSIIIDVLEEYNL